MKCCSCHTGTLLPTRFDDGPACYQCNNCNGALLSLSPYLDWVKSANAAAVQPAASFDMDSVDTKKALSCPKCSRIMLRYNALADKAHGLDYCFHCEEVWLDPGEWLYLKGKGLHTRITSISTDAYQRRLREQASRDAALQRFRASIGDEAFDATETFRTWLAGQPHKAQILRHLANEA